MQIKRPDDATGDSVILARVHAFLAALLSFLGFRVLPTATIADMLDELVGWLDMAKAIRRDPQGATARIWWDAFKMVWDVSPSDEAGRRADSAVAEFGKRFLPVNDEDRDTLNTADFDAMRIELDQADLYRQEICNALDGRDGERAFVHPRVIDELRAERDALLKTNAHHANEIEALRMKLQSAIVPLPKPECVEPGQRWAFVMTHHRAHGNKVERFVDITGESYYADERDLSAAYYLGTETK